MLESRSRAKIEVSLVRITFGNHGENLMLVSHGGGGSDKSMHLLASATSIRDIDVKFK